MTISLSKRHRILQAIETSFGAIVKDAPVDNPYMFEYSEVTRLPVTAATMKGKRAVLGIYPTTERKTPGHNTVVDVLMRIVLEIHITRDTGENLADNLELALKDAERRCMESQQWGGLAIDTNVIESDTNIDGQFANTGNANLYIDVKYRHNRDDPAAEI